MHEQQRFFNQFEVRIDKAAIERDFVIVRFFDPTYNLSYKEVAKLDKLFVLPGGKVLAVTFPGGGEAFALYEKAGFQSIPDDLREEIDMSATIQASTASTWRIKDYKLLQLFLNACANSQNTRFQYSNLTGKLYITAPNRKFQNKRDQSRMALEVKVKYGSIFDLKTRTFTSTKRYQDLIKDEYQKESPDRKRTFLEAPVFLFDSKNRTFRRHFGDRWEKGKSLYVPMRVPIGLRAGKSKKNEIPFFSTNPKDYPATKIALLNELLFDVFQPRYGKYVAFLQRRETENGITKAFKPKKKDIYKDLANVPVYLIDNVGDESLKKEVAQLAGEKYGVRLREVEEPQQDGINLQFNLPMEAYATGEDPYRKASLDLAIQNFTSAEFEAKGKNQLSKTLQEAYLKWNICQRKLSIFDWSGLGAERDWYFTIAEETVDKEQIFHFLQINPDGRLNFSTLNPQGFHQEAHEQIAEAFSGYGPNWKKSAIEGLIMSSDGQINIIETTELRSFPNLESIHRLMDAMELDGESLSTQEVLAFTTAFITDYGCNDQIEQVLALLENQVGENISLEVIQKPFKKKNNSKLTLKYVDTFYETYGRFLKNRLRNQESTAQNLAALVDIHNVQDEKGILFWGNRPVGATKGKFDKTNVIRRLAPWQDSELLFDKLLETMAVDFVRVEGPTVIPFPFKLLREYQKMAEKPELDLDLSSFDFTQ